MTRRSTRSDSATAAVEAMRNAALGIPAVPDFVELRPRDRCFWEAIAKSRARDEWTPGDIVVGVHLARTFADIEREGPLLEQEGSVVANRINPRFDMVNRLHRQAMALMRTLKMGGRVSGDARDLAGRRGAELRAREVLNDRDDDYLA